MYLQRLDPVHSPRGQGFAGPPVPSESAWRQAGPAEDALRNNYLVGPFKAPLPAPPTSWAG